MIFYTQEVKEEIRCEIELALFNLSRCIAFDRGLDVTDKTYYECKQLRKEYLILKDLREIAVLSTYYDEDLVICEADYHLVKKWGRLNLQTYKELSSNVEG